MTACRNKASRAVTAALVGVLSVGAVPMVALAATDGAAPMASVDPSTAFSQAKVTLSRDSYVYNGGKKQPKVVSVELNGHNLVKHDVNFCDHYLVYYVAADEDGNPGTEKVTPVQAGTYYAVVEAVEGADYPAGSKAYGKFTISGKHLEGATYYEGNNTADNVINYIAEPANINFLSAGGFKLTEGVDYTVKYYTPNEDWRHDDGSETAPTDAGTYYAHLTGIGAYAGTSEDVHFTINPCNLTAADVYVETVIGEDTPLPKKPTTVNGSEALAAELKLVWQDDVTEGLGHFTAMVVPDTADTTDPNFSIDKTVSGDPHKFISVDRVATGVNFTYNGEAIPETIVLNKNKDNMIHPSMFSFTYVDKDGTTQKRDNGYIDFTVTNPDGTEATGIDLNNANWLLDYGTYTVTLKTVAGDHYYGGTETVAGDHYYGGTAQFKLLITNGTLNAASSMYVSYDDVVMSSFEGTYDGSDFAPHFDVALYDGDRELTRGDDFDWHFEKDGKVVNQVRDAGEYQIVATSDKYQLEDATFDITISKAEVQAIRLGNLVPVNGQYGLEYNDGDPIKMVWQYTTGERDVDGKLIWYNYARSLVAQNSEISVTTEDGEAVKNLREVGDYVGTLKGLDTMLAANFEFKAEPYEFSVIRNLRFVDVTPDMYYYGSVMTAFDNGYVYGYNDGKLFGPTDSMSRADVAVVLYRMSGVRYGATQEGQYDETSGWKTGYEDVDGKAYYAEAVAWARKAGVVAGLDDTHFGPEQKVTREQFATMLANYAKARGQFEAADESVLDKYGDADQVSAFAKGTVAWAVEEGVMGGSSNLMPTSEVTRADVAVMAVNYQPVSLVGVDNMPDWPTEQL